MKSQRGRRRKVLSSYIVATVPSPLAPRIFTAPDTRDARAPIDDPWRLTTLSWDRKTARGTPYPKLEKPAQAIPADDIHRGGLFCAGRPVVSSPRGDVLCAAVLASEDAACEDGGGAWAAECRVFRVGRGPRAGLDHAFSFAVGPSVLDAAPAGRVSERGASTTPGKKGTKRPTSARRRGPRVFVAPQGYRRGTWCVVEDGARAAALWYDWGSSSPRGSVALDAFAVRGDVAVADVCCVSGALVIAAMHTVTCDAPAGNAGDASAGTGPGLVVRVWRIAPGDICGTEGGGADGGDRRGTMPPEDTLHFPGHFDHEGFAALSLADDPCLDVLSRRGAADGRGRGATFAVSMPRTVGAPSVPARGTVVVYHDGAPYPVEVPTRRGRQQASRVVEDVVGSLQWMRIGDDACVVASTGPAAVSSAVSSDDAAAPRGSRSPPAEATAHVFRVLTRAPARDAMRSHRAIVNHAAEISDAAVVLSGPFGRGSRPALVALSREHLFARRAAHHAFVVVDEVAATRFGAASFAADPSKRAAPSCAPPVVQLRPGSPGGASEMSDQGRPGLAPEADGVTGSGDTPGGGDAADEQGAAAAFPDPTGPRQLEIFAAALEARADAAEYAASALERVLGEKREILSAARAAAAAASGAPARNAAMPSHIRSPATVPLVVRSAPAASAATAAAEGAAAADVSGQCVGGGLGGGHDGGGGGAGGAAAVAAARVAPALDTLPAAVLRNVLAPRTGAAASAAGAAQLVPIPSVVGATTTSREGSVVMDTDAAPDVAVDLVGFEQGILDGVRSVTATALVRAGAQPPVLDAALVGNHVSPVWVTACPPEILKSSVHDNGGGDGTGRPTIARYHFRWDASSSSGRFDDEDLVILRGCVVEAVVRPSGRALLSTPRGGRTRDDSGLAPSASSSPMGGCVHTSRIVVAPRSLSSGERESLVPDPVAFIRTLCEVFCMDIEAEGGEGRRWTLRTRGAAQLHAHIDAWVPGPVAVLTVHTSSAASARTIAAVVAEVAPPEASVVVDPFAGANLATIAHVDALMKPIAGVASGEAVRPDEAVCNLDAFFSASLHLGQRPSM